MLLAINLCSEMLLGSGSLGAWGGVPAVCTKRQRKNSPFVVHMGLCCFSATHFHTLYLCFFFWGQLPLLSLSHHSKTSSLVQSGYFTAQNSERTAFLKSYVLPEHPACVASSQASCTPLSPPSSPPHIIHLSIIFYTSSIFSDVPQLCHTTARERWASDSCAASISVVWVGEIQHT